MSYFTNFIPGWKVTETASHSNRQIKISQAQPGKPALKAAELIINAEVFAAARTCQPFGSSLRAGFDGLPLGPGFLDGLLPWAGQLLEFFVPCAQPAARQQHRGFSLRRGSGAVCHAQRIYHAVEYVRGMLAVDQCADARI